MTPIKNNLLHYRFSSQDPAAATGRDGRSQTTRLTLGHHFADIVPDYDGIEPVFHWVIQRVGSPEILRLGQEASFAHALDRAHECLEGLEGVALRIIRREKQPTVFYEFGEMK
jgi:hypothetical protein